MDTLSLRPRNVMLDKFNKNDVLSELDDFLKYCREKNIEEETITDVKRNNVKTL